FKGAVRISVTFGVQACAVRLVSRDSSSFDESMHYRSARNALTGVLLRRSVPVPGILATHRPGAIMDKSGRQFVVRYKFADDRIKSRTKTVTSVTDVLTHKCYRCPDCALRPAVRVQDIGNTISSRHR